MWTIDEKKTKALGNLLIELRANTSLGLVEVANITKIQAAQLSRLEHGTVYRINSLMLKRLAELYDVDVLTFYKIIDYI